MRHGNAPWNFNTFTDNDRVIDETGALEVRRISEIFNERGSVLDLLLCSPSQRTSQTMQIMLNNTNIKPEIKFEQKIYQGSTPEIKNIVYELPDEFDSVMIIGHNPTIASLASSLCNQKFTKFDSAGLAIIEFNVNKWISLNHMSGELILYNAP